MDLLKLAEALDALRVVPRIALGLFLYLLYDVLQWYKTIPDLSMAQAGVLGALLTSAPFWFNLYVNSGPGKKGDKSNV